MSVPPPSELTAQLPEVRLSLDLWRRQGRSPSGIVPAKAGPGSVLVWLWDQVFLAAHQRTAGVIQSRLDGAIRPVFRRIQQEVKRELIDFEHDLERVVSASLQTTNQSAQIPELQALDLQHPLVLRAHHVP